MGESNPHHDDDNLGDDIGAAFRRLVNLSAASLRRWLDTEESQAAGLPATARRRRSATSRAAASSAILEGQRGGRTRLHPRGRRLHPPPPGAAAGQRTSTDTRWRYSLMNWGHDPMQDSDTQKRHQAMKDAARCRGASTRRRRCGRAAAPEASAPRRRASRAPAARLRRSRCHGGGAAQAGPPARAATTREAPAPHHPPGCGHDREACRGRPPPPPPAKGGRASGAWPRKPAAPLPGGP